MCLKSCFHSLESRPIQVNVSQGCFHSLNNYSGLIILSTSGGYLKLINHIISDKRIQLLAGIPLCKSQELSQREHSTSRLCSIHHDIKYPHDDRSDSKQFRAIFQTPSIQSLFKLANSANCEEGVDRFVIEADSLADLQSQSPDHQSKYCCQRPSILHFTSDW